MSAAAWAAVASITVALIGALAATLQLVIARQKPAEERSAGPTQAEAYKLTDDTSLVRAVVQLSQRIEAVETTNRSQAVEMEGLQDQVTGLRSIVVVVVPAARKFVLWIDGGAQPPPPVITDELREILDAPIPEPED